MWRACRRALGGSWLLLGNTASSGLLMGAGDQVQQRLSTRHAPGAQDLDWTRTRRMMTVGLIQGAPQHWFYIYLDKFLPGTAFTTIFKKIVLDQLIASPFCIILFFAGMGLLEGKFLKDCINELKEKFSTVYLTDCCVWPPAQFINFYFLPGQYRVIYINFVTMLYNIFLSYVKHTNVPKSID